MQRISIFTDFCGNLTLEFYFFVIMEITFLKTINFHHQLFSTHHIKLMTQVYSKYFLQEVRDNFFLYFFFSRLQKLCSYLFFYERNVFGKIFILHKRPQPAYLTGCLTITKLTLASVFC